jgi:predicted RNase H-like HicB family nuclease
MPVYVFNVVFEADEEDGGYVVSVPELPEVCTQGDTLEESKEMAEDAILCALDMRAFLGQELPGLSTDGRQSAGPLTQAGFRACIDYEGAAAPVHA